MHDVCREAEKAHGIFLFSYDHFFNEPMTAAEKKIVIGDLKALMQSTHPDKAADFEDEFKQLQQALAYVRSKLDLLKTPHKKLNVV